MGDLASYALADLILFSARSYHYQFESYNLAFWPMQLVALLLCVGGLLAVALRHKYGLRLMLGLSAMAWGGIAWEYLHQRFSTINWVAEWYAPGFGIQALLLGYFAVTAHQRTSAWLRILMICCGGLALFYPLLSWLPGRGWMQSEVVLMAPDPTVLLLLGLLLMVQGWRFWAGIAIPGLWCLISGATLWVLEQPHALLLPVALLVVLVSRVFSPAEHRGHAADSIA